MDLWVRSQDKELLMKCVEIRYNQKGDDHSILSYDTRGDYRILGKYKTKERVLEILDEIQTQLVTLNYQYIHKGEHFIATESNIYEMPEE